MILKWPFDATLESSLVLYFADVYDGHNFVCSTTLARSDTQVTQMHPMFFIQQADLI